MNIISLAPQVNSPTILPAGPPPDVAGNASHKEVVTNRAAGEAEAGSEINEKSHDEHDKHQKVTGELSKEELAELRELRNRDREVRAHEMAHLAAAGRHSRGGASFTFQVGPDGRRYAVGGEVSIDTSPVNGDPAATLEKARQIQRAALAPAEPSAQDRRIAAQAAAMAAKASAELAQVDDSQVRSNDATTGLEVVREIA